MNNRLKVLLGIAAASCLLLLLPLLTTRRGRNSSEMVSQRLKTASNKTDSLRSAMRHLGRMTPFNRRQTVKETQLALNTWMHNADLSTIKYSPPKSVHQLDQEMREIVGCGSETATKFSVIDIDYLYQSRIMKAVSDWVVQYELRDSLMLPIIERKQKELTEEGGYQLLEAYKLFDWTMRNVGLDADMASVTTKSSNPSGVMRDYGPGYSYLPWETLLFCMGDFIEKGRVFTALAAQRGIKTAWIVDAGYLFAIGVLIDDEILLFEPKLAMPVLDPDKMTLASLDDAINNPRVLRRLDLPGRFDYAFNPGDLKFLELFVDLPPTAASSRMQLLEKELLGDERMRLYHDADTIVSDFQNAAPEKAVVKVWDLPLKAQIHATQIRSKLDQVNNFTREYMTVHAIWMKENPAAKGRLKHLFGKFEKTLDEDGAFKLYMGCRFDAESLRRLEFDPNTQRAFGMVKDPNQTAEQYQSDVMKAVFVMRKAKVDSSFLLAQAHFDQGNYEEACSWFLNRIINNEKDLEQDLAERWSLISRYCLARAYQERGMSKEMEEQLSYTLPDSGFINPHEAGNRLRLRYLKDLNQDAE